jgi:hypothetical protein
MKMIFLIVLISLLSVSHQVVAIDKIIGGEIVRSAPFHATIIVEDLNDNERNVICGGSLYKKNWVITAAHCLEDLYDNNLYVSLGVTSRSEIESDLVAVQSVFVHEDYNPLTIKNDIALLYLGKRDEMITSGVVLDLPDQWFRQRIDAYGFGNTSTFGTLYGDFLESVDLVFLPRKVCEGLNSTYQTLQISEGQFCTTSFKSYGKDTCQGDSGGPLIISEGDNNYLLGVTSFGIGCAQPASAGVNTFVPFYKDWIDKTINDFIQSSTYGEFSNNYCYNSLYFETEEAQDVGKDYISFYNKKVSLRNEYLTTPPSRVEQTNVLRQCRYNRNGLELNIEHHLGVNGEDDYIKTGQNASNGQLAEVWSEAKYSFDVTCFNENSLNFLVTLSLDEYGSYLSSVNLSPFALKEISSYSVDESKAIATCNYKSNYFTLYEEIGNQYFVKIDGEQYNAKEPRFFRAGYSIPADESVDIKIHLDEKKSSVSKGKAIFEFINKTKNDIFNWKIDCSGMKMSFSKGQKLDSSPIFGKEIFTGEYIAAESNFLAPAEIEITGSIASVKCTMNDIDVMVSVL